MTVEQTVEMPVEVADEKLPRRRKAAAAGMGDLVIVESPTKARTLARMLGPGYTVEASFGHIRDPVSYTHLTLPTICSV